MPDLGRLVCGSPRELPGRPRVLHPAKTRAPGPTRIEPALPHRPEGVGVLQQADRAPSARPVCLAATCSSDSAFSPARVGLNRRLTTPIQNLTAHESLLAKPPTCLGRLPASYGLPVCLLSGILFEALDHCRVTKCLGHKSSAKIFGSRRRADRHRAIAPLLEYEAPDTVEERTAQKRLRQALTVIPLVLEIRRSSYSSRCAYVRRAARNMKTRDHGRVPRSARRPMPLAGKLHGLPRHRSVPTTTV